MAIDIEWIVVDFRGSRFLKNVTRKGEHWCRAAATDSARQEALLLVRSEKLSRVGNHQCLEAEIEVKEGLNKATLLRI